MSKTGTAALPTPDAAYDHLFGSIHSRVFFHKCAAAGFSPRTPEESQWMLETAGKLREVAEHEQVKAAAAQDNPYFQMSLSVDTLMDKYGLRKQAGYEESEAGYKQAAAQLMQDPLIYNAVLALKAHEAEDMKGRFDAWAAANPK